MSETHEFKAEVSALLKLVTNSLYTNSEIFLRELISNASDALDKARFEALVDSELEGKDIEASITITANAGAGTLIVEDTGIGLSRDEAARNLGTIAHSGTMQFLQERAEEAAKEGKGDALDLIGQFGVGFYSAFMVADHVDVYSRSARPGHAPIHWSSTGEGNYELREEPRDKRGTRIVLKLSEEGKEYLEPYRIRSIVKRYSNHVMHPISLVVVDEEGKEGEAEQLNTASAIWSRSSKELSEEDYAEFYKHIMGGFTLPGDEALTRLHFSAEAPIQFHALLFVPSRAPADLFMEDRKALQLFARRVMVMESNDKLLPSYLRFFRGVVDSEDLPLNVSREMLQEHKSLSAIRRQLTRKALKLLEGLAADETEKYEKFWGEFGAVLKEGLHMDGGNREALTGLLRYKHTGAEGLISLADYVAAMGEGQEVIYYIAGLDESALRSSPHLEALAAKGHDVLLMTDAVDEWVLESLSEFDGKKFHSVTQGDLESEGEGEDKDKEAEPSAIDPLLVKARAILGERVKDVRASKRLTTTAACLVDASGGLSRNMERILRMANRNPDAPSPSATRVLELNPDHALVKKAFATAQGEGDASALEAQVEILLDLAALAEGSVPDPAGTVRRIQEALAAN
jgi:molecular chaperone HtpG